MQKFWHFLFFLTWFFSAIFWQNLQGVPEKTLVSVLRLITPVWKQLMRQVGALFKSSALVIIHLGIYQLPRCCDQTMSMLYLISCLHLISFPKINHSNLSLRLNPSADFIFTWCTPRNTKICLHGAHHVKLRGVHHVKTNVAYMVYTM